MMWILRAMMWILRTMMWILRAMQTIRLVGLEKRDARAASKFARECVCTRAYDCMIWGVECTLAVIGTGGP
eukprot:4716218-Pyramimonas_sp.AAC.1